MAKNNDKQLKGNATVTAHARYLRISPRKMRLVTNLVKNTWALDALAQLRFVNKKGAAYAIDVIKSAIANGQNNFNMKPENLYITSITCDAGAKLKRYMPRAQGRASEIRRPLSHVNVVLEERETGSKRKKYNLGMEKKEHKPAAVSEEKTARQDAAEDKNITSKRNQTEKTSQDIKKSTVQQKRRLFNRKSGV